MAACNATDQAWRTRRAEPRTLWACTKATMAYLPVDNTDRALFAAVTRVTVRNGKQAAFWTSSWLHGSSPASLFPRLHRHSKRKNRTVHDAIRGDAWIRGIAHHLSPPVLDDYFNLWELINSESLQLDQQDDDEITWTQTANGQYSAKSAYNLQFLGSQSSQLPALIWKVWVPPRIKVFMWLLLQHQVWTAGRLQRRGWPNEYFCTFCYRNLETVHHLFIEYPETGKVWTAMAQ